MERVEMTKQRMKLSEAARILPDYCDLNKVYEIALSNINIATGLELSLIEKVILRHICEEAIKMALNTPGSMDEFPATSEASTLFLERYYGISIATQREYTEWINLRLEHIEKDGFDKVAFYFQKLQEEAHHEI